MKYTHCIYVYPLNVAINRGHTYMQPGISVRSLSMADFFVVSKIYGAHRAECEGGAEVRYGV